MFICKIGWRWARALQLSMHRLTKKGNPKAIRPKERTECTRTPWIISLCSPPPGDFITMQIRTLPLLPGHTHLIGNLRVGIVIGLLRRNGQHGRVGLLGTLIVLDGIVLIVPRQRRHIWHPAITNGLQSYWCTCTFVCVSYHVVCVTSYPPTCCPAASLQFVPFVLSIRIRMRSLGLSFSLSDMRHKPFINRM